MIKMSPEFAAVVVAIISGIFGLSNFAMFLIQRHDQRVNKDRPEYKMILGLGHDIIISRGEFYIARGCITKDEYENLNEYLYKPYLEMGGNGTAKKIMAEIDKMPLRESCNNVQKDQIK